MSEIKTCPKCGGEMKSGILSNAHFREGGFWRGNRAQIYAFVCKSCGYVELYIERKE